jgi:hypothetical protein
VPRTNYRQQLHRRSRSGLPGGRARSPSSDGAFGASSGRSRRRRRPFTRRGVFSWRPRPDVNPPAPGHRSIVVRHDFSTPRDLEQIDVEDPLAPGFEAWCARGSPTSTCSPRARSPTSRIECRAAAASFGSSPADGAPRGSVRPGANGLSRHSAQYADAPPPMTCASCAASVGSSGRRRSSIRSASGRWPMSTYVSPRYSMACGKSGRRRSASW